METEHEAGRLLLELTEVLEKLRAPDGCPWDLEQDHLSLRPYLIEESYEVLEAIELGDMHKLAEELGDLLLQVVFHAQLAKERGDFDISEPLKQIIAKMQRRHPHVFSDVEVKSSADVRANWEAIKAEERSGQAVKSLLETVPRSMPALLQAYKLQKKAATVGFDWDTVDEAWEKVWEENEELAAAVRENDRAAMVEELGDLFFALVNIARFLEVEPEAALLSTVIKFRRRFSYIEAQAQAQGKDLTAYSLNELDKWWEEAKQEVIFRQKNS